MNSLIAILTFLAGGSLVASLVTQILKKAFDGISNKYGALASQATLLVVSLAISGLLTASALLPEAWLLMAGAIFMGAVTIYEVLYKAVWKDLMGNK